MFSGSAYMKHIHFLFDFDIVKTSLRSRYQISKIVMLKALLHVQTSKKAGNNYGTDTQYITDTHRIGHKKTKIHRQENKIFTVHNFNPKDPDDHVTDLARTYTLFWCTKT